ncbi:MAG: ribonuclease H-like domain-containing protein [Candidatus Rokubacteria bacterium]|nr:ribonuclease H-like domain-containing protein [Candidatus Rokubacteria bacterium]MBI2493993.1 ribonuclease H-like domain-containing protein [Candidatus Rokubacteria bacterium]MBI4254653.1 ribonuclease H-like domain-containing protein [Candidatus Rokubacteria bacterium]
MAAPSLDDLRRVIRRLEARRPPRPAGPPVHEVAGGELLETDAGPLVVVRREYPLAHRHGRLALADAFDAPEHLPRVLAPAWDAAFEPGRLVFLDTETTGLAGGTGTYAFLVGAGWREDDRVVVAQFFMRDFDEEPALLAALAPVLARASGIVSFNGAGFDLPLLETRFVLARRRWPAALAHLDLLRPARRLWSGALGDCRLGTLEREVLGLERAGDVAGALIPSLYFEYLRSRRATPLAPVFEHNRADVLSLVTLLGWFCRAVDAPAALPAGELAGLGRLWEPVDLGRSLACYRQALAAGLAGDAAHRVRLRLAGWEKRRRAWDEAHALWEAAARHAVFDPRPWEELAKLYEHRRRDLAAARAIVARALALAGGRGAPGRVVEAFAHRLARLDRRLAARG